MFKEVRCPPPHHTQGAVTHSRHVMPCIPARTDALLTLARPAAPPRAPLPVAAGGYQAPEFLLGQVAPPPPLPPWL
jgi:hypothetical protein